MAFLLNIFALLMGVLVSTFAYAETESLPALDAKFETTQCAIPCKKTVKRDWWLMRAPLQVELRDVEKKTGHLTPRGEIWKHSPDGKMSYLFLMHDDKRAIEYLFDDLKVLGIKSDENQWQIISQLVSDTELAGLRKSSKKSIAYQGYSTESYVGAINGAKVKLTWLPQLKIPVKLEYVYAKSKVTIQLNQLNLAESTQTTSNRAPKTTEEVLDSYQQVYYTDIGDMEQSDDAKEWLAKAQGAPGLHSHHH
jgi:hypothetical protein